MIYLASPYSSPDPDLQEARYEIARRIVAGLLHQGKFVFSPIVYGHEMAKEHNLPTDAEWWKAFNEDFMRQCTHIYVLRIPKWNTSLGVQHEMDYADRIGIPVAFINYAGEVTWP